MSEPRFRNLVTSTDELAGLVGTPSEIARKKELTVLDEHMTAFIGQSPFLLLGTVGRNGRCDVSPRGDLPCVARVEDSRTLLIPDRRGNRRVDSLRNIIETGRVGLLFVIPGHGETLRVNGKACVFRDEAVLDSLAVDGKRPIVAIGVEVEECYFQCAKAILRSRLWGEQTGSQSACLASFSKILLDQTKVEGHTVESLDKQLQESYATQLY